MGGTATKMADILYQEHLITIISFLDHISIFIYVSTSPDKLTYQVMKVASQQLLLCQDFLPFQNICLNSLVPGIMDTLANHGVAQTLRMSLSGSKTFVRAYAVANLHTSISS